MEKIEIKNFGPIKNVEIEIKDVNVFIGKTSSGKSVVAKLISIFNSDEFIRSEKIRTFYKLLKDYNIDFGIDDKTYMKYTKGNYYWMLKNGKLSSYFPFKEIVSDLWPLYEILFDNKTKFLDILNLRKLTILTFLLNFDFNFKFEKDTTNKNLLEIKRDIENIKKFKKNIDFGKYDNIKSAYKLLKSFYRKIKTEVNIFNPLYIPAERIILSMVAESVFGLLKNDVSLAECIKDFGSKFESARQALKNVDIDFLQLVYKYSNKENILLLGDGAEIKLEQASSGFQSLVPLFLVIEHFSKKNNFRNNFIVVEEPELNLYPTVQKYLVEYLIQKVLSTGDKIVLTTHSPYVLTTLDNLIQAKNVVESKPDLENKVKEIIPEEKWLAFNRVSSYYFKDGYCRPTLDNEMKSIGPSNIDDVSDELSETYEKLLELKYS